MLASIQSILPQHLLTKTFGSLANSENPAISKILKKWIYSNYSIDLSIAEKKHLSDYPTLQALFTRKIDMSKRPLDNNSIHIVSPADSRISQFGKIQKHSAIQAKGFSFDIPSLLGNSKYSKEFEDGDFITLYLAPHDYHRVHMPMDGKLVSQTFIPGKLFSVNNYTANNVENLFVRNERLCCIFETEHGLMAQVLVGAMIVGSIFTVWGGNSHTKEDVKTIDIKSQINLNKGDEMGMFAFGSTVINIFPKNQIAWHDSIKVGNTIKVCENMASIII